MHDEDSEIILGKFKKPNKEVLVKHLFDAFQVIVYCKLTFLSANRKRK